VGLDPDIGHALSLALMLLLLNTSTEADFSEFGVWRLEGFPGLQRDMPAVASGKIQTHCKQVYAPEVVRGWYCR